jgi:hypothetical protein
VEEENDADYGGISRVVSAIPTQFFSPYLASFLVEGNRKAGKKKTNVIIPCVTVRLIDLIAMDNRIKFNFFLYFWATKKLISVRKVFWTYMRKDSSLSHTQFQYPICL